LAKPPRAPSRCGELDAGILLYLLKSKAYDLEGLEKLLYKHAGLLGLSGISGDMRELLVNKSPDAALAIEYFVYQIVKFIGSYATILGGLDAIVFTRRATNRSRGLPPSETSQLPEATCRLRSSPCVHTYRSKGR
jgi:acetate kinase